MMNPFAYKSPQDLKQAVADLGDSWGQVDLLAGGTDLLVLMKEGIETPKTLVNIKGISGLGGISLSEAGVRIGATATLDEIATHPGIGKHLPALAAAAAVIGGPQIRNLGTLGGNLCQRNRDWYFRNGLNPPQKEENQYLAIFPMGGAVYVSPSTLAPPLIAYGATAAVAGPKGTRKVPVDQLFQVAEGAKRETTLAPNEIVTEVLVPVDQAVKSADYEVRERDSHDWPLTQASVALVLDGKKVKKAAIVLGHVAPVPVRAREAEAAIVGKELTPEVAAAAGQAAVANAKPMGKNGYKVTLTEVAVKRALLAAIGNEYWRAPA